MTYQELFECGENYHQYLGRGTRNEILEVSKVADLLNTDLQINQEALDQLLSISKPVKLLVAAEMWCPFCQLQLSVLNKICEINSLFKMSIITKGRAEDEIKSRLEIDEVLIPVVVILDERFEMVDFYSECPSGSCPSYEYENIKSDCKLGGYLNRTVTDLIKAIK